MAKTWVAVWGALLLAPGLACAAPELALVTILDGEAIVIRDTAKLALAEGVRLAKDDIVETGPKARLLRLEYSDGAIVDLGPDSRVLLAPRFAGERARLPAKLHLLQGWAKVSVPKGQAASLGAFTTPLFDVASVARSAVFSVAGGEGFVFAESGDVVLHERTGGKTAGTTTTVKGNEFLACSSDAKAVVTPRPTPSFIQRVPRPFLDTLPSRAAVAKSRDAQPRRLADITYADAQPWIDADGLRPAFAARWKALAQNPEFRKGLVANLRAHPEWDRTLYPEKYLPRPASGALARPPSPYPTR